MLWCVFSHVSFAKEGVDKAPRDKLSESARIEKPEYQAHSCTWQKFFCAHGTSDFSFYFYMEWMLEFMYLAQGALVCAVSL